MAMSVTRVLSKPVQKVHMQTTLSKLAELVTGTTLDPVAGGISHQAVQPTSPQTPPFSVLGVLDERPAMIAANAATVVQTSFSRSRSPGDHLASDASAT